MDKSKQQWQSKTIEITVHRFKLGDVEDPELYVAEPIYNWQQTELGKYVMEHSSPTPMWVRDININTYGYDYKILAYFTPEQLTYYKLRFE